MNALFTRHRFACMLAALFIAQLALIALCLLLLGLGMAPPQRAALHEALTQQAGMLAALAAMLLMLLAALQKLVFDAWVTPLSRLAEQAAMLSANPGHRAALEGARPVRLLAGRLNALAAASQRVRDEGQARIDSAMRSLAEERNRLAALMADLALGVLVCNLEGRILLYNTRAAQLLDSAAAVGLGRSVFGVIERGLIVHALEQVQHQLRREDGDRAGGTHPVSGFAATLAAGQVMRIQMAPVLDLDFALNGFVLTVEDISRQAQAQDHDSALLEALTHGARSTLANIRAAAETLLAFPDMDAPRRLRFIAAIEEESQRLAQRVDASAARHDDSGENRWQLEEMRGADLMALLLRRMQGRSLQVVPGPPPDATLWLNVDSYGLCEALTRLAERISTAAGPLQLDVRHVGRLAQIELAWEGAPPPNGDPALGLMIARHGGESMLLTEASGRLRWRLLLPAQAPRAAVELPRKRQGRPEFYDFDLFHQPGQSAELDAQPLARLTYTVFDTETTGMDPAGGDDIISIGALRIVNGRLLQQESFERLLRPRRAVSPESMAIHGISDAMLKDQPGIAEVLPVFHRYAEDSVLVAHNAAFDMRFLRMQESAAGVVFGQPVLDTLLLSQVLHPNQAEHSLEAIAARLGVAVVGRHTALGDAIVTAEVFLRMLALLAEMGIVTLGQARDAAQRTPYARIHY